MRISDWSSDVCSAELSRRLRSRRGVGERRSKRLSEMAYPLQKSRKRPSSPRSQSDPVSWWEMRPLKRWVSFSLPTHVVSCAHGTSCQEIVTAALGERVFPYV